MVDYLLIATYLVLIMLAMRNICVILVKQKEYKNLPILTFYVYALMAVTIRPIVIIWQWVPSSIIFNVDYVQQAAKLCVGVVQDWITLELAIRIRNGKVDSDISEATKKKLRLARLVLFAIITLVFIAFSLMIIVQAHGGYAFHNDPCLANIIIGYAFLL